MTVTKARDKAVEGRNDLSRFLVHLTRDDREDAKSYGWNGGTAAENFIGIMEDSTIYALRPHCLHLHKIPEEHFDRFSVCCFMEVPLPELHLVTRPIQGRRNQYSDYGFVFSRDFLVWKGAQPAIYVNSYGDNSELREAADSVYAIAKEKGFSSALSRLVPHLNAMNQGYDFAWEREWRIAGNLKFELEDIACVILPEQGERKLKAKFLKGGIPVISPGWTGERIVAEFSKQARRAHRAWKEGKRPKKSSKQPRR